MCLKALKRVNTPSWHIQESQRCVIEIYCSFLYILVCWPLHFFCCFHLPQNVFILSLEDVFTRSRILSQQLFSFSFLST